MLKSKKNSIIVFLILLFILIGGVCAADNQTADDVVEIASDDAVEIDGSADYTSDKSDDLSKEIQTDEQTENDVGKSVTNDSEILGAPAQRDALGVEQKTFSYLRNTEITTGGLSITKTLYYNYVNTDSNTGALTLKNGAGLIGDDGSGGPIIINAMDKRSIFTVSDGAKVTIKNIIFMNAKTSGSAQVLGGAFNIGSGANVTFEDCKFETCTGVSSPSTTVRAYGGAIYAKDRAIITLQNCNFSECSVSATSSTSFISSVHAYAYGGAVHADAQSTIYLDNCNFLSCTATSSTSTDTGSESSAFAYGGAICIGSTSNIIINKTKFDSCSVSATSRSTASATAGAVFISNSSDFTVDKCNFTFCSSVHGGGAIRINSDSLTNIRNCIFEENSVSKNSGGAIFYQAPISKLNITHSNFTRNKVTEVGSSCYGGALSFTGQNDARSFLYINKCKFEECEVEGSHSVMQVEGVPNGHTHILNSEFKSNKAKGGHSTVCITLMDGAIIDGCTFEDNTVLGSLDRNSKRGGAGLYIRECLDVIVRNSKFINNNVTGAFDGGGIYSYDVSSIKEIVNCSFYKNEALNGAGIFVNESMNNILFKDCNFTDNYARNNAGAVYMATNNKNVTFNNATFKSNKAVVNGSSVYIGSIDGLNVVNSTFENNGVANSNDGGAALQILRGKNIFIDHSNFTDNDAKYGGAIIILNAIDNGNLTIQFSQFKNNTASNGEGGAIYLKCSFNDILIKNSLFDNNTAKSGGAVMFYSTNSQPSYYNNIDIIYSNFTNNKVVGATDYGGSAIGFNRVSDVDIKFCKFDGNNATANGALMFDTFKDVYIYKSNFTNNNASNGGAIYHNNLITNYRGNSTFEDCKFDNNFAKTSGGAVFCLADDVNVINSNFTNNNANYGGAFISTNKAESYDSANKNLKFDNVRFINNSASRRGGALDSYFTKNTTVDNCVFENNTADDQGAGIWINGFYSLVTNSNFTNNTSPKGSAIAYIPYGLNEINQTKSNITNCKFERNTATGDGGTVWFESSGGKIDNCNFTNNTATNAAGIYININKVNITNSNFTINRASNDAGAIYLSSSATGTNIKYCNFTNNSAVNGGAVVVKANGINITSSHFTYNSADKGGAIYYETSSGGVIDDVVFKNNTANDGGAVYYASQNPGYENLLAPIQIKDSEFINNTAKYNGGAAFITLGDVKYRDYNLFNGLANNQSGTVSWTGYSSKNYDIILNSVFENNIDYMYEIAATTTGTQVVVSLTVPEYYDKSSLKIKVVISNSTKNDTYEYPVGGDIWQVDTLPLTLTIIDHPEGEFNVTVTYSDVNLLPKELKTNITVVDDAKGPFTRLQEAIDNAIRNNVKVLEINGTIIYSEKYDNGQVNITAPITIVGKDGTTISAENFSRIFYINATNVTLKNIKFINGNANGRNTTISDRINGGAILWDGDNGTIENCNFTNNTATNGGAVFVKNNGTNGKIIASAFENNTAVNHGGAVDWNATGGNVSGSTFTNNKAAYGGAVFVGSNSTHSYIINSNFTNNDANERGGAIDWYASSGDIEGSTFKYNDAKYGGAVFVGQKSEYCNITNSTFFKNTASANGGAVDWNATGGHIIDSKFYNNTASANGGAVFVGANGTSGNITNSVFENNSANRGGAVDWYATSGNIVKSNFTNNIARENGGAVYMGTESENSNITSSRFIKNHADSGNGGAVDWNASEGNLRHSYFEGNTAQYGGAVFRGSNATRGIGFNNTFVANHAEINGGAVDWNASSGRVNGSKFYNNTAGKYGGAIFVGSNSTESHIYDSLFDNNSAIRGGAIDWYAASGDIEYSNFTRNHADYGGAVFVGRETEGGNITHSRFENNYAVHNGGAVDWNATGGNITYSVFKENRAENGGAVFVGTTSQSGHIISSTFTLNNATRGGAVDWNASWGEIFNSTFNNNNATYGGAVFVGHQSDKTNITESRFGKNTADYGGAVFVNGCGDLDVADTNFTENTALSQGGAIYTVNTHDGHVEGALFKQNSAGEGGAVYLEKSDNFDITDSEFESNTADLNASDIFINQSSDNDLKGLTVTANNHNSIYVNADAALDDVNVTNGEIRFASGTSTLSNSKLEGNNPVLIDADATVALNSNNNTNNNGNYSVFNNGTLSLDNNNFANVIMNNGTITSKTNITVLANSTVIISNGTNVTLNASILDDNHNSIVSVKPLRFLLNETLNVSSYYEGRYHFGKYTNAAQGVYYVSFEKDGLEACDVIKGTLKVKSATQLDLNVTKQINQGQHVEIEAKINPGSARGNVTFIVNGEKINRTIDANGIAKLILENKTRNYYTVEAIYDGDDTHFESENRTSFVVELLNTTLSVQVKNIIEGNNATVIVTTNATGNVTIRINNRDENVEIKNGRAELNVTGLTPGNYTVLVTYPGNDYYVFQQNSTEFTVHEFSVDVVDAQYGKPAIFEITVPKDIDINDLHVYVNGTEVSHDNITFADGIATVSYGPVTELGEYEVNVTYDGVKYGYNERNGTRFTVNASSSYDLRIEAKSGNVFGNDTVFTVNAPKDIGKVNITVGGHTYSVNINSTTGIGTLTLNNLSAATHTAVVSFAGDDKYGENSNSTSFTLVKATPDLTIKINDGTYTGGYLPPNEDVNISVFVGVNATGIVLFDINGTMKGVNVVDGYANYTYKKAQPGVNYNVSVEYYGDNNYTGGSNSAEFDVNKYPIEFKDITSEILDNNTIVFTINLNESDAGGSIKLNISTGDFSTSVDAEVNGGKAIAYVHNVPSGSQATCNVTYSGNDKYLSAVSDNKDLGVIPKLNNLTIGLDVTPREFGKNTTITVTVPSDVNAVDLIITINGTDGTPYPITPDMISTDGEGNQVVTLNVSDLSVGKHTVNVTYEDEKYNLTKASRNFTIGINSDYLINVTVVPAEVYGNDTLINVTVPKGIPEINVTVGDKTYLVSFKDGNVTVDGKKVDIATFESDELTQTVHLTVGGLPAGTNVATASYAGDENYTAKSNSTTFTIGKATPVLDVSVVGSTPGENVTISVKVSDNATGDVAITVDGVTHVVPVNEDGYAVYNMTNAQPGTHNVTAQYLGDDNYNKSDVTPLREFEVGLFNITIKDIEVTLDDNNSAVVKIIMNESANGTVTVVTDNGQNVPGTVVNGVAVVDLDSLGWNITDFNITVTYNRDARYNSTTNVTKVDVPLLSNASVVVDAVVRPHGENTTVIITVPADADGKVTVDINGTPYGPFTPDAGGRVVFNATPDVGLNEITAVLTNSSKYNDATGAKDVVIDPFDDYVVGLVVEARPYGENSTITVTVPAELKDNVVLTIDGDVYEIDINDSGVGVLNVSGLAAVKHDVVVTAGNENYTTKTNRSDLIIPKGTPVLDVSVVGSTPGENVTISVKVSDNATGDVAITVDGVTHVVPVNEDGYAVYNMTNAQPGTHNVTAQYLGDDNYNKSDVTPLREFEVGLFNITIKDIEVTLDDNNSAVVKIVMNESANGTVTVVTDNGQSVPGTVVNGVAVVDLDSLGWNITDFNITVTYNRDARYNSTTNVTKVDVPLLSNATVVVDAVVRPHGENTTVIITVPADAGGNVTLYVNGTLVDVIPMDEPGKYMANVTPDVGPNELKAILTNSSKYNDATGTEDVVIDPFDDYVVGLDVEARPYGENSTITVTVPAELKDNVVLTIDGDVYEIDINDSGVGVLNVSGLDAVKHDVVVTAGNENYTTKTNRSDLIIPKGTPVLDVDVVGSTPGENVTISVKVSDNATGDVAITVDGVTHVVPVDDEGYAVYNMTNAQPGIHNVTAQYLGDDNYNKSDVTPLREFEVGLFNITIKDIEVTLDDNNRAVVKIVMNESANGTVTVVTDNGQNVPGTVVNGVAVVDLDSLGWNITDFNITVTYNKDARYDSTTNVTKVDVPLLSNATVVVDAVVRPHGENTTVIITVPADADGKVVVDINGTSYGPFTPDADGRVVFNATPDVGLNEITAVLTNSSKYNDATGTEDVVIDPFGDYVVGLDVEARPYGENSTITVTVPAELKDNVVLTIDGDVYEIDINDSGVGVLNVSGLAAVKHDVVVTAGNENYTTKTNRSDLIIPKCTPVLDVGVEGNTPGENVTISVKVGPNATGKVAITVDGIPHIVPVKDGYAIYNMTNAQPGVHNVTAQYFGDGNYTESEETPLKEFEVDLFNITISEVNVTLADDNSAVVVVKMNESANGNITIVTENGQSVTAEVINGVATADLGPLGFNEITNITVTYLEDARYSSTSNVTQVELPKLSNLTVDVEIIPRPHGENTTIIVTVPEDFDGNVTIIIDDVEYNVTIDENGTGVLNVTPTTGNHTLQVKLNESDKYNDNITDEIPFEVPKSDDYTIDIDVDPGKFNENTTITVTVPQGIENVTIIVDGVEYFRPVNETTGQAELILDNLTAGNHTVTVKSPGNENYTALENSTEFEIEKANPDMTVDVDGHTPGENVTVTVNVGPDATGYVTIVVDNQEHTVPVDENGTATYVIEDAQPGVHNVTAKYLGDDNFNEGETPDVTQFTVDKFNVTVEIIDSIITENNNVTVIVQVNESDAGGNITVTLPDGSNHTAPVNDGIAEVNLGIIEPDTTPALNITYSGDDKYNEAFNNDGSVEVPKLRNGTLEVEIDEGEHGKNTTITVTVPSDFNGNVTIIVDGDEYPVDIDENGTGVLPVNLTAGNHTVEVKATNSSRYEDNESGIIPVTIPPTDDYPIDIDVTPGSYGENTTVTVKVPVELKDNVTVTIDGVEYPVEFDENGTGIINVSTLSAGEHEVVVECDGDENYTAKTENETFNIPQSVPVPIVEIEPIDVGEVAIVNVTLPDDATGHIIVTVNGTDYFAQAINGSATVEIPNLGNGTHGVTIKYSGDENYTSATVDDSISVSKLDCEITANTTDITLGENAVITVEIPEDATGTVTVTIADITKTVPVNGGENEIIVPGVPVGTHEVTVTYNGDGKYNPDTATANLTVKPTQTKAEDVRIEDTGNGTIIVTVPENATGNVTLTIDNETVTVPVVNGSAVINLTNLTNATPGVHNVTVKYSGDENHTAVEYNTTVTIPKLDCEVTARAPTIREGDDAIVYVEINRPDATGLVLVDINGIGYYADVVNGKANVTVPKLTKGTYGVAVTYLGDNNYTECGTETELTVEPPIEIHINGTGNSSAIVIDLPENGTDNVTVLIDGKEYNVTVINGTAVVNLTNVTPGEHNLTVIYTDADGGQSVVNTTITVPKWDAEISATAPTIREGDDAVVTVTVSPAEAGGFVHIDLDGVGYYVNLTDGVATLTVPGIKEGKYDVTVTYLGDERYAEMSTNTTLTVQSAIGIDVNGSGNNSEIVIDIPDDANGNVTVLIDGEEYANASDVNGTVVIPLENITPGVHNVTVIYTDADGGQSVVNTTITVPKWDAAITAKAPTIREGDDAVITVTVDPSEASGFVHIDLDGVGYYANFTDGVATLVVPGIKEGKYDVIVTYPGDDYYAEMSTNTTLTVQKAIGIDVSGSGNDSAIVIDLPENTTGNLTVLIDGEEYAAITDANGTVVIPLENITPGEHNVTVKFTDSEGTESVVNTTITVPKWDAEISATAPTIREGDDAVITVDVAPSEATGKVLVDIDGKGYYADVEDGKATVVVSGLKAGTHDVAVNYLGDDTYAPANTTVELVVEDPITVGLDDNGNIVIQLPENATGNVTVELDGEPQNVTFVNGTAQIDTSDLEPGIHNVTVTYTDEDGTQSKVDATIVVPKKDAPMDVEMTYDGRNKAVIDIALPEDATGVALVDIDGKGYYVNVTDGKAQFEIEDLPEGEYNVTVTYLGDDKYNNATVKDTLTVAKKSIATMIVVDRRFTRVANDWDAGERGTMFYGVLMDTDGNLLANKKVQIAVNGPIYNVTTDAQGRAGLQVNLKNANTYTYALFFQGDDLYNASHIASTKLTVTKKPTTISASAKTFKASAKTKTVSVTLKTSKNPYDGKTYLSAGKKITVKIDGKTYTAKTDAKGVAKINIKLTKKGKYTAKISFAGDKTYSESSKSIKITIN